MSAMIGITALLAASLLLGVSAEGCIPTVDMPCRGVNLECTDIRNVSHFLEDEITVSFIEQGINDIAGNLTSNGSLTFRFDFTGSVKLSEIFPDTFETIHLPAILTYDECNEYVNDYTTDLQDAIFDFLETETNLAISIIRCQYIYQDTAPPPPSGRKLLDITQSTDYSDMVVFYSGAEIIPDQPITVTTDHGVNSAGVNGSISTPVQQANRRRLLQSGAEDEESLCRLSLKFRGYVASSYNGTKPWQVVDQESPFSCNAEFREDYESGESSQLAVSEACGIEDGLAYMEESCGPSPVKVLDDFPETFPAGFDPVSEVMPTLQSYQPPSNVPEFFPDADICTSSPEALCDLVHIFGEEVVQYMLSWFTPNDSPSITLLDQYYQAIC